MLSERWSSQNQSGRRSFWKLNHRSAGWKTYLALLNVIVVKVILDYLSIKRAKNHPLDGFHPAAVI